VQANAWIDVVDGLTCKQALFWLYEFTFNIGLQPPWCPHSSVSFIQQKKSNFEMFSEFWSMYEGGPNSPGFVCYHPNDCAQNNLIGYETIRLAAKSVHNFLCCQYPLHHSTEPGK